jgi:DNA-binding MarR family transcriptional regulator
MLWFMKSTTTVPPIPTGPGFFDSLVVRTLLATARQRPGLDERRCLLVLDWLKTGSAVRAALHESLVADNLSYLKFSLLVVLFTIDPEAATPADLADHAGVTRSAVTEALDGLEKQVLVAREHDLVDRRTINVRLTGAGRAAIDAALQRFLQTAGRVARFVGPADQAAVASVGARLRCGATA